MALVQQVSDQELYHHLNNVLSYKYTRLDHSINVNRKLTGHANVGGNAVPFYMHEDIKLNLVFYVDEMAKYDLPRRDVFTDIEYMISNLCSFTNSVFTSRSVEPFSGSHEMKIRYELQLRDYDSFVEGLIKLATSKADKEFIEALETKLSED